jgi:ATP-dependent DNA ligase
MNIWEFLGLPSDHRPEDKTVQLVRHFADVEKKISLPTIAQRKFDGIFTLIVFNSGRFDFFGRTGRRLTMLMSHIPTFTPPRGNVAIIAELCCDLCSLEALSGLVNPNRKRADAPEEAELRKSFYFVYHDMVYVSELINGESKRDYRLRELDLKRHTLDLAVLPGYTAESVLLMDAEECDKFAQEMIDKGFEGAVFKDPEAGWIAGRKNEVSTKKVRGVDFDLLVVGYEEGKGKHKNMVGKLVVRWCDFGDPNDYPTSLPVDGCFTQEMRKRWWAYPQDIIGKIVHVHALQLGSKGALRLPKVKAVRIDKTVADL